MGAVPVGSLSGVTLPGQQPSSPQNSPIYSFNTNQIKSIYYGNIPADSIFLNAQKVWPIINIITGFWEFSSPSGKTLTAFNVEYEGGQVTADWGDGSSQILTSGVNYNKTFS
jgi:hypothetical protein